jgi:DNA-binding transcriptional MerR regulator
MEMHPDSLMIGKLAKSPGVGVETIRFYEREGLLRKRGHPSG